jgi:hypothetical protein
MNRCAKWVLDQAVKLLGCHARPPYVRWGPTRRPPAPRAALRSSKKYHPSHVAAGFEGDLVCVGPPCGHRLRALSVEWLPAYEMDRRRIDPDVRRAAAIASRPILFPLVGRQHFDNDGSHVINLRAVSGELADGLI